MVSLSGAVRLDPGGAFISTRMDVGFTFTRDGKPMTGTARVEAFVKDRGRTHPIAAPLRCDKTGSTVRDGCEALSIPVGLKTL
mgnify:CR=1 FL=1